MSTLPEGWLAWVRRGLLSRYSPLTLLDEMAGAHIEAGLARQTVLSACQQLLDMPAAQLAEQSYQYERSRIADGNTLMLADKTVPVVFRIAQPDIAVIDGFLSDAECEALICLAADRLVPSTVANLEDGSTQPHQARSSSGMYFSVGENALLDTIEQRLASLTGLPVSHGEGLQMLHYLVGKEYQPHYDYFPEQHAGSQTFLAQGGQRVLTMIMYLNDVEAGGETVFPAVGLKVLPRKGSLLYFSYTNSQGQLDPRTLHGGAPVVRGEKWIATKWVRMHPRTQAQP